MTDQARHDFLNNCIRIEVLNKLLAESIDKKEVPEASLKEDLEKFLTLQLGYLKNL